MRDFNTKIDNNNTSAGVVVADEYNSMFAEAKGAVTPFMGLSEADNKQLAKSIDIASKAMFYTDTGTPNAVILERGATTETLETLFDGMVIMFTPVSANTGATTLKIKTLDAKSLMYNGAVLNAGYLKAGLKYIAVYDVANDRFNCDVITLGLDTASMVKNDAGILKDLSNNELFNFLTMPTLNGVSIIATASNANGTYIYFADGTALLHYGQGSATTLTPFGNGMYFNDVTFTLPVTLVSVNRIINASQSATGVIGLGICSIVSASQVAVRNVGMANNVSAYFGYIVLGRWK